MVYNGDMKLTIQGELCDLNNYIKALNNNRYLANNIKQGETERVMYEAMAAKIKPIAKYPVKVKFHWYSADQRKDSDNVAFAKKFALDGLVRAKVLVDDSRKYVSGFSDNFYIDKKNPRLEIEI